MPDNEFLATLYTPEMSSETVRTMLTLFYTGEATLNGAILKEINDDFLTVGELVYYYQLINHDLTV